MILLLLISRDIIANALMRGPMDMMHITSETVRKITVEVILQFKSKRRYQY
jgi:hypothetical protein